MVFDPIGDSRKNRKKKLNKKMEQRKKETMKVSAEKGEGEGENDSSWPRFSEEDYIVFCFEEDGGIHIVEDKKSEAFHKKIDRDNLTSKPVCRKVMNLLKSTFLRNFPCVKRVFLNCNQNNYFELLRNS